MKTCSRCKTEKPRSEFYPDNRAGRDLLSNCKECGKDKQRAFRQRHGPRLRIQTVARELSHWNRHLIRKYGISAEDYARMLAYQGSKCAICGRNEPGGRSRRLHVDHDHLNGRVRGLLCTRCNQMIGYAGDDPAILYSAAQYCKASLHRSRKRSSNATAKSEE